MTNRDPLDSIRTLEKIELSTDARSRIRQALSSYAELHAVSILPAKTTSVFSGFGALFTRRATYASFAAFVLVIATGTQATLAAEDTVPGDILYPVKVKVSEPIALALTPSGEKKAELASTFATRRVKEAAALSERGTLDEETAAELSERFDTHVAVIAQEAEAIEADGEVSASLAVRENLEEDLTESAEVLAVAEDAAPEENTDTARAAFTLHVKEKTRHFAEARERLAAALSVKVASSTDIDAIASVASNEEPTPALTIVPEEEPAIATTVAATSTATSTEEAPMDEDAPSERIFKSFFFKGNDTGWGGYHR